MRPLLRSRRSSGHPVRSTGHSGTLAQTSATLEYWAAPVVLWLSAADWAAPQNGWGDAVGVEPHCRDAACDLPPFAWLRSCGPGRCDCTSGVGATTFRRRDYGHRDDDAVDDRRFDDDLHFNHQHNDHNHNHHNHNHNGYHQHLHHPHDPHDYGSNNNRHHVAATDHEPGREASPDGGVEQALG